MSILASYLAKFSQQKILVVGDIIADEFITGQPQRLSREAPVLILEQIENNLLPGGGTNAANNIAALGGQAYLAGVIGDDTVGNRLRGRLQELGIITKGLVVDSARSTSIKTRIMAGGNQTVKQQIVRLDNIEREHISPAIEDQLCSYIETVIDQVNGIILSDYGNGVFTKRIQKEIVSMANQHGQLIAVDSRYQLQSFQGITIATPNKEEAESVVGYKLNSRERIEKAGWQLKEELKAAAILITLSGEGMQLFTDRGTTHIPASNFTEVFDVTGAGDTVVATLVLALVSGAGLIEAMKIANYAAGIVVKKSGVATVNISELKIALGEGNNEGEDLPDSSIKTDFTTRT